MEQSDDPLQMYKQQEDWREVIFVLRVRASPAGWRGQVHRLDLGSLRYIANHSELFTILTRDWDLAISANSADGQRLQE